LETNIVKREDIDTIGLSMYAYYNFNASPNDLYLQMKALETDWHLSSMIVETNYPVSCTKNKPSNWAGGAPPYELSVDGQLQWFQALYDIQKRLSLTIDHGISVFEPAFMTNKPGGSHCEDILLFAPDKDDYKKAIARKSIDLFKP
jgi:arabinogalactan endo-1,4-beta-galactosidase